MSLSRRRRLPALATALLLSTGADAGGPAYRALELEARSNIVDGFNLPPNSSFSSGTPAINDDRVVALRLIVVGGTSRAGMFVGQGGTGGVVYQPGNDHLIGDPGINTAGIVLFEQFDIVTDGLFAYDPKAAAASMVVAPGGPFSISSFTRPAITDDGALAFRARSGSLYRWIRVVDGVQTSIAVESGGPTGIGFLFSPATNASGLMAGKVRIGGTGNERPDQIRRYAPDGTFEILVEDVDGDPSSPFTAFDNSVAIAADGRIAFIANLVGGGRGVFRLESAGAWTTIATTLEPGISEIQFFWPAINAAGTVAFRGRDGANVEGIFAGDGRSLVAVARRGDRVSTDLGAGQINQHDTSLSFGGSPAMNEAGDIAFLAALTPAGNTQVEWGTGLFVARAAAALHPADLNGDGTVNFADALLLLAAWGTCERPGPGGCPEDLDGDGEVGFADLLQLLGAWN